MPVLQLNDRHYPLGAGPTRIGSGDDVHIALPGESSEGAQAEIDRPSGGPVTIRRTNPSAQVRVNGVLLGAEPTPLMHGDRVEIGGLELRYADDTVGGATQFVSVAKLGTLPGTERAPAARAAAASGGRLVSLVDGKEYLVPDTGLLLGRDASCDVVVAQNEVSRRHAEIAPGELGYVVRDMSANGVFVNGERVQGSRRLARSDVLRIGTEEFRFHADATPAASSAPTPVVSAPATASAAPAAPAAAPVAADAASAAMESPPTSPAMNRVEDPRPELASLEILNEGPAKGTRFGIRSALAHVGRGAHNDVRLADDSVSETHAKLQRRDDGWYVVDMDSTNGTYVGGTRINGERRLEGTPDVRFGGMKMRFSPADAAVDGEGKGTRAIASVERLRRTVPASAPAQPAPEPVKGGMSIWVWVASVLLLAAAAFFLLGGRA
ncbi:MAG TPA: FHA domain-containing protein [Gemmatimonadaceae bacterium]|jgi:pSer/pThr/pTyr-binding forkhead associated (FHA) protein